jgi:isopentenyl phosphate kinase
MIFLKLGGSLITDKTQDNTLRPAVLQRLAHEIAQALLPAPHAPFPMPLLLGHGSGSFGHAAAKKHGTRAGVTSAQGWRGFAAVSVAAARLNRLVADALHEAGVPVISVLPSASVVCADGVIQKMDADVINVALARGLVPLVMGDVALDTVRGGTIISTEEVFAFLCKSLPVKHILLAGETAGVYERYDPAASNPVVQKITPQNWAAMQAGGGIGGSRGADVTGGMVSKVRDMVNLVQAHPAITVHIFSGMVEGNVRLALLGNGAGLGTQISAT